MVIAPIPPPSSPPPSAPALPHPAARWALLALLACASAALVWILLPFFGAILWAAIIALLFTPWQRWLLPRLGRRRTLAALLTTLAVLVIVILPFALLTAALASEAAQVYQRIASGAWNPAVYLHSVFDALPGWAISGLHRLGLADFAALQTRLSTAMAQGSQFIAMQALGIGLNTFDFVTSLFITLYLAFFLIRDGQGITQALRTALPLAPAHKNALGQKFSAVVRATVTGNLVVAAVQGLLGGLAFWALGVDAALLWAVLMAFLSLLPAIGAGLVWGPVALYFLVTGALWQGLALVAYGMGVIGLVDNLLRPVLVGRNAHLPDYMVMISTLGGMAVFGLNGFVIGPAIAAMFVAVWQIATLPAGDVATP